jgi:hypothetical protein
MNKLLRKIKAIRNKYIDDYVFIHINKTGGSSIEKALSLPFEHKTARQKIEEFGLSRWESKLSFAVIRNPWDKVVSHYHYRVLTNQTGMANGHIDFNRWVQLAYGDHDPRYYDQPMMFMPQKEWLIDDNGNIVVDRILRFENLSKDFNELAADLGIRKRLPHVKKSNRANDFRRYYNKETVKIIADSFAQDIDEFGYDYY